MLNAIFFTYAPYAHGAQPSQSLSIYFLLLELGEFVSRSRLFVFGDHSLDSHNLHVGVFRCWSLLNIKELTLLGGGVRFKSTLPNLIIFIIFFAGAPYSGKASDMWALGVVLYTMLYGQFPFYDSIPHELFRKIKTAEFLLPKYVCLTCFCNTNLTKYT